MLIFLHRYYSSFKKHALPRRLLQRAFTLIELLVVISIMMFITSILLLQQKSFNSSTILRSLTYGVALSVRQAQLYGTSVRGEFDSTGATVFASVHGIHFNNTSPTSYDLFADKPAAGTSGWYDAGTDILVNAFKLGSGYTIKKFCVTLSGTPICSDTASLHNLSIVFRRPDPDACFTTDADATPTISEALCDGIAAPPKPYTYTQADITIQSPGGSTRTITVTQTGQIYVGDVTNP